MVGNPTSVVCQHPVNGMWGRYVMNQNLGTMWCAGSWGNCNGISRQGNNNNHGVKASTVIPPPSHASTSLPFLPPNQSVGCLSPVTGMSPPLPGPVWGTRTKCCWATGYTAPMATNNNGCLSKVGGGTRLKFSLSRPEPTSQNGAGPCTGVQQPRLGKNQGTMWELGKLWEGNKAGPGWGPTKVVRSRSTNLQVGQNWGSG